MIKVPVSEIPRNSVLGAPILDSAGRILLREGVLLSPKLLQMVERWNIGEVTIRPESGTDASPHEPAQEHATPPRFRAQLFDQHAESEEMQIIHRALLRWQENASLDSQTTEASP